MLKNSFEHVFQYFGLRTFKVRERERERETVCVRGEFVHRCRFCMSVVCTFWVVGIVSCLALLGCWLYQSDDIPFVRSWCTHVVLYCTVQCWIVTRQSDVVL